MNDAQREARTWNTIQLDWQIENIKATISQLQQYEELGRAAAYVLEKHIDEIMELQSAYADPGDLDREEAILAMQDAWWDD